VFSVGRKKLDDIQMMVGIQTRGLAHDIQQGLSYDIRKNVS